MHTVYLDCSAKVCSVRFGRSCSSRQPPELTGEAYDNQGNLGRIQHRLTDMDIDLDQVVASIPVKFLGGVEIFGEMAAFLCSDIPTFPTSTSIPVDSGAYGEI